MDTFVPKFLALVDTIYSEINECEEGFDSNNKVCKDETGGYRGSCDDGSLNYYYLSGIDGIDITIDGNGPKRDLVTTITASGFCDYYENVRDKKTLLASYYRRTTKNQVLIPFLVDCLENGSETKFIKALQHQALAVFNDIADIVRVSVLEYKPIENKNNCRLGCSA